MSYLALFTSLFAVLLSFPAHSQLTEEEKKVWTQITSGQHSLQALGPNFYVPLAMKPIENAELLFLNTTTAKSLGLPLPQNSQGFAEFLTSLFAVEVDPTGKAERKMMATNYQDSNSKKPGEARGDGRAAWTGELQIPLPNGKTLYVDIVEKGIGVTPLAWTNHGDGSHSDGKQSTREGVYSFIMSRANQLNQLDTTVDLAVFGIRDPESGRIVRSITVRVGNQTRMAHFRYHADNPGNFKRLADYIIRRDLGLPLDTTIEQMHVTRYLHRLAKNLAEEAARYVDLNSVVGSPTVGNRTSKGSTIDLAEFWYFDAYHREMRYLYNQVDLAGQVPRMSWYLEYVHGKMIEARYPTLPSQAAWKTIKQKLDLEFRRMVTRSALRRMGLNFDEINRLSIETKDAFFKSYIDLTYATAKEKAKMVLPNGLGEQIIHPAAYDTRTILSNTFKALSVPEGERAQAIADLFKNDRSWSKTKAQDYPDLKRNYLFQVQNIVSALSPQGIKPEWIQRAEMRRAPKRPELGTSFFEENVKPIIEKVESGKFSRSEINNMAESVARKLVDPELTRRTRNNLGHGVNSCRALFVSFGGF